MKVAVLGCRGLVGRAATEALQAAGAHVVALDREALDITRPDQIRQNLPAVQWCLNCAGYSFVEAAEQRRVEALAVNAEGARAVAASCARRGIRLLHMSTYLVFDGRKHRPYSEVDEPAPLNLFGQSKLVGEKNVRAEGGNFLIVRAAPLYGPQGRGMIADWLEALRAGRPVLRAPSDETVAPTYVRHLAEALVRLIARNSEGVVHVAADGRCTWAEFAEAMARKLNPATVVESVPAGELSGRVRHPPFSVLDTRRLAQWTGHIMPPWQQGLADFIADAKLARPMP